MWLEEYWKHVRKSEKKPISNDLYWLLCGCHLLVIAVQEYNCALLDSTTRGTLKQQMWELIKQYRWHIISLLDKNNH